MSRPGLVSTAWLADRLGDPRLRLLDASWYLPTANRDPRAEFGAGHLPGAQFFDLDAASDPASQLPHMLPTEAHFASYVRSLGVSSGDWVVVYDGSGNNLSAPRAWWMFRAFGHRDVAVLDGGLGAWRREGRALEEGEAATMRPGDFTARLQPGMVRHLDAVREAVRAGGAQLVDMRSAGRFMATEPEPRAGLRGGHIPGSRHLHYARLVDAEGRLLEDDALRAVVAGAGVGEDPRPVIASCGSGVSACALVLALHALGRDDVAVYDGSWTEWGGRDDTPVETGPAR
ncbi:MAG TPA: 3-mercaptopyruvate sulfurtransferase [Gemmatimonadales bacterium]|nr:3-mercaptopyruvate sulfurtransferase [Gemmatimonadales bacterium]